MLIKSMAFLLVGQKKRHFLLQKMGYNIKTSSIEVAPEAKSVTALEHSVITINGFNGVLYNDVPNGMPYETKNLTPINCAESTNLSFAIENLDTESAKALCGLSVFEITLMPQKCFHVTYNKGEIAGAIITGDAPIDTNYYYEGDVAEVKDQGTLACEGYNFDGWADEDETIYQPGEEIEISSNVILTAQWIEEVPKTAKAVIYGDALEGEDTNFVFYYDSKDYNPGDTDTYGVVKNKFAVQNTHLDFDHIDKLIMPDWYGESGRPLVNPTNIEFSEGFQNFTGYIDETTNEWVNFESMDVWFLYFGRVQTVTNAKYLPHGIKSVSAAFSLILDEGIEDVDIDISECDFSNVENASYMFAQLAGMFVNSNNNELNNSENKDVYLNIKMPNNFASGDAVEDDVNLSRMFWGQDINSIEFGNNFGANATDMSQMFDTCKGITSLDLSSFNTKKCLKMSGMFYECSLVQKIFVGENWDTSKVLSDSGDKGNKMFYDCSALNGENGTNTANALGRGVSEENYLNATMACVDTWTETSAGKPGYFSTWDPTKLSAKAVIYQNEGTDSYFVFYYDNLLYQEGTKVPRYGTIRKSFAVYNSNVDWDVPSQLVLPAWFDEELNPLVSPTSVVFDKSFENFKEYYDDNLKMNVSFNNMSGWFAKFITAKEFSGFENIYDGVKNIDCIFTYAFIGQSSTPDVVLDLRRWKLPNLQSAKYCFGGTNVASSEDSIKFNKLSNATYFSLKKLYLPDNFASGEKTENVSLCGFCALYATLKQNIETIDLGKNFGKKAVDMSDMFYCCQSNSFENISSMHTENCQNMANMFYGLRAKELDLSSFDTRQVTDMSCMFYGCKVNRIYASKNFDTTNVLRSNDMFTYCTGLEGIKGSKLGNAENRGVKNWTDKTCARIDTYGEEDNLPGYFSPKISKSIDVVFYSLSEELIGGRINAGTTASQPEKNVVKINIPFGAKTAKGVSKAGINWIKFIYEENGISIVQTYYAIPDEGYSFDSWGELPEIITEDMTVIPLSFVATTKE